VPFLEPPQFDKYQVVFFLLGDYPAPEFYAPTFRKNMFLLHRWYKQEDVLTPPMKIEQKWYPETSAHKIQTPGNHPQERMQHSEQGESLK
jgi:hypothetical protein